MAVTIDTEGNKRGVPPKNAVEEVVGTGFDAVGDAISTALEDRIAAAESAGMGTVPTSIVYAGALTTSDNREAARTMALIARHLDIPPPPARPRKKKPQAQPVLDPYTGDAISLRRAQQLYNLGAQLGQALSAVPAGRRRRPADPELVLEYVRRMDDAADVSADFALAWATDMTRTQTDPVRFGENLREIQRWNGETATLPEEEVLVIARWWTEHRDTTITPGNIVNLTAPELREAIERRQWEPIEGVDPTLGAYAKGVGTGAPGIVGYSELQTLLDMRSRAIEDASNLRVAQQVLGQMEAPTWIDRAVATAMTGLENLWHAGQHVAVDVSTPFVLGYREIVAALPGGPTMQEAYHRTLKDRSYLIQRVNGGASLGQVLLTEQYNAPPWVGVAFDFAVGWRLDPFVVGGKLTQGVRTTRLAPTLTEAGTLRRALTPQRVLDWEARIQYENYGGSVLRFSRSKDSRRLFDAASDSDEALFRQIDRLATNVEARSALEYEFMRTAAAALRQRYPRGGDAAWAEWQNMMRAHFGIQPPPGSLAAEVVALRGGASRAATQRVLATPTGEGLVVSGTRVTDDVIEEATAALTLRAEVPHRLLPVPGLGGRRLASLRFAESGVGRTRAGTAARTVFNVNPGNVFRVHGNPEQFLLRRGTRWRSFSEPELRTIQSQAAEIIASGASVETRLRTLLEQMDTLAMRRIGTRMGIPEEGITDAISDITFRTRRLNSSEAFGVLDEGAASVVRRAPLTESQLINEVVVMDPILVRKMFRRYQGTVREMARGAVNNLGGTLPPEALAGLARDAYRTLDIGNDLLHGVMRTWKFTVVPRPAYIGRVVLGDENLRFLATTGSLLERVAAQELRLLPANLRSRLDDALSETIGQGDNAITIGRTGTYQYEPLANQAFRDEELLDDLLRRSATQDRALRSLGAYGRIDPSDPQHAVAWMRALNLQLGNSVPGRIALSSVAAGDEVAATIGKLRRWAQGDGYVTLRSRVGVEAEGVDEWADFLGRMTHQYTAGRPDLADLAIARSVEVDLLGTVSNPPAVHGPLVEALTGAAGSATLPKRFVETWYRWMVRQPENILNRQPYYKTWKRSSERSYYRMLEQQGVAVTDEIRSAIDAASRDFSLAQVKRVMFDFTENTRIGEMVAAVVPFSQPWAEAYSAWGHILLKRNPAMIGYVRSLWSMGRESGFIEQDPDTGAYTIPWTFWQRVTAWLPWVHDEKLPPGIGLSAPLSSFNQFLSGAVDVGGIPIPTPGLAPWAGIPLKDFFAGTENPLLASWLFNYGPQTPVVSSWMERGMRALRPGQFTDQRETSISQDFLRLYQYLGTNKDEDGNPIPQRTLIARARSDARTVNGLLATTGFLAPTAGRITFPEGYEAKEEELNYLRDTLGFEMGTDRFLARNPELTLMTIGKTVTTRMLDGIEAPRLPSSEEVEQLLNLPQFDTFAKRFPWAAAAVVLSADEQWDDSSLEVFGQQVHDREVRYKGLGRFLTEGQAEGFWNAVEAIGTWYYPAKDRFEGEGLGTDNERILALERRRREALYDIYLRYPDQARRQGFQESLDADGNPLGEATWISTDNAPPSTVIHSAMRDLIEFDGFEQFPAIQGLTAYYQARDPIAEEMQRRGIDDIRSTTAERAGLTERWETALATIGQEFPEATPFISKFLDDDLSGLESAGERRLRQMRDNNPERYQQYVEFDSTWENILDSATNTPGLSAGERNARYEQARDYSNTVYASDPKLLRLWYESKSASGREAFRDTLLNRPPVFYSRFDWETMGLRITDSAAEKLDAVASARAEIDQRQEAALRAGDDSFVSGPLFARVDAQAQQWMKQDKAFAKAVEAINAWGWALWQPEAELVTQRGKAGFAWQALQVTVESINEQARALDLHGDGLAFGDIDDKRVWFLAREAVNDYITELSAWSPVFGEQVSDLQRGALRGTPLGEFLIPPVYFPLGG